MEPSSEPVEDWALEATRINWKLLIGGIACAGLSLMATSRASAPAPFAAPVNYCIAKTSSQGCVPSMGWTGLPKLSTGPGSFDVHVSGHELTTPHGLFFYGLGPTGLPWLGGFLCAAPPLTRVLPDDTDPGTGSCSATETLDFWAIMDSGIHGLDQIGQEAYVQYYYRDTDHPDGTGVGLSDALSIIVSP